MQEISAETPAASIWEEVKPLWVSGLALFCVLAARLLCHKVFHIQGEHYEWILYLTLGLVFPALLLALTLLPRRWPTATKLTATIQQALVVFLVLGCGFLLFRLGHYYFAPIVLLHWGLTLAVWRKAGRPLSLYRAVLALGLIAVAWVVAIRFLWWSDFNLWFYTPGRSDTTSRLIYRLIVFGLSFALVFRQLMGGPAPVPAAAAAAPRPATPASPGPLKKWLLRGASGLSIIILLVVSFRTDDLFDTVSFFHWATIIGPAAMLQQGGWLYWDVPAQYGFLSTLTIAALPTPSVWQSFYILDALLLFGSALFIFCLLRSLRPGFGQRAFALLLALCSVFLICGWPAALSGPQTTPAIGAFRFCWAYVLLTILVLYARCEPASEGSPDTYTATNLQLEDGAPPAMSRRERQLLVAGCCAWLLGTLWSLESAIFCSAIWLPAYGLIILQQAALWNRTPSTRRSSLRFAGGWLALPGALFVAALGGINAYYLVGLKHLPDWRGFFEYSFSFANGFFALPIDMRGAVLTLFLIFCACATVGSYFLQQRQSRPLSLIVATWWMLWATSSYFVPRSHENNASALTPLYCAGIAVMLSLLHWYRKHEFWTQLLKASLIPVLTIILTSTLGTGTSIRDYFKSLRASRKVYEADINRRIPRIDASMQDLLQTARAKPTDPIVLMRLVTRPENPTPDDTLEGFLFPAWPVPQQGRTVFHTPPRAWLPTAPLVLFAPLTPTRRQVYMARYAARAQLGGWLAQERDLPSYDHFPWFSQQLLRTHRPTKMFQNAHWRLTWFDPKPR